MQKINILYFLILIISCGIEKKDCQYLGKKHYQYDSSSYWLKMDEEGKCKEGEEEIVFNIDHESCLNLEKYKLVITVGKRTYNFGTYSERNVGKICCVNKNNLSSIGVRLIDVNLGLVYQWSKKESYTLCQNREIYITLPYDNQNLDYSIDF